jgi:hypothetical protein
MQRRCRSSVVVRDCELHRSSLEVWPALGQGSAKIEFGSLRL